MPKVGHTFAGFTSSAFTGTKQPGDTFSMPASNVTLTAQWTVNTYSYVLALDGGTDGTGGTNPGNVSYGATVAVRTVAPTKDGHTFASWSVDNGIGTIQTGGSFVMPAANTTATAIWTVNTYIYSIDLAGGTGGSGGTEAGSVAFGATVTLRTTSPTKTGSTFDNWRRSDGGANMPAGGQFVMPSHDVTVTATWTLKGYTVTYNTNGGTDGPTPHTGVTYGSTVTIKDYS